MSEFTNLQTYRRYSTFEELLTPQHVIYTFILLFFFFLVSCLSLSPVPRRNVNFFRFLPAIVLASCSIQCVSQVDPVSDVTCARACSV